jgi:hypothetical protein
MLFASLHYVDSDDTSATLILIALAQHIVVSLAIYISTNLISLSSFPFFCTWAESKCKPLEQSEVSKLSVPNFSIQTFGPTH